MLNSLLADVHQGEWNRRYVPEADGRCRYFEAGLNLNRGS
jgi:hypothetical protein